jgi:signal transduction histidine kinase
MVHDRSPLEGPRPASALAWMLPVAGTAAATAVVTSMTSSSARVPILWIGAVATVAVAVLAAEAARRGRAAAALRAQVASRDSALAKQEAETVRLARELLPQVVSRLRQGEFPEDVLSSVPSGESDSGPGFTPEFRAAHQAVLRAVVETVSSEEDLRESAHRAFVNIARRVQAIVHQQAQELRDMEDRHGNSHDVFGDLLRLDHGNALIGRLADSIAVLGGARPGRQWSKPVPLFSVLRGGMSRIIGYQRVELHSVAEVAVVGPAVEPLIHALAELLDNATRYSPPDTQVHLTAVEVQSGIAIEIEDGGVSMSEEARRRAERMLQQAQEGIDLNDLGESPRLGLAVVGRLAQAYEFQISLRPSAYGGVRAVLVVPQNMITTGPATGRAHGIGTSSGPLPARTEPEPPRSQPPQSQPPRSPSVPAPRGPERALASMEPGGDKTPAVTERTTNGLPQRRRKTRVAAPAKPIDASPARDSGTPPGMWMTAFQSGLSGETPATAPASQNSDESPEKSE